MPTNFRKRIRILSVEDNASDRTLMQHFFSQRVPACEVSFANDGEEALEFLKRHGQFAGAKRPDLILLDLNLPGRSGLEVLDVIKSSQEWRQIPVIVLSSSSIREDILKAYNLQANSYLVKPSDLDEFNSLMSTVSGFWTKTVELSDRDCA